MPQIQTQSAMSAALIAATHTAIRKGINTGRLGGQVLTNEAKGTGKKYRPDVSVHARRDTYHYCMAQLNPVASAPESV